MIKPGSAPQQSQEETRAILEKYGVKQSLALLGVRGYFRDSMGAKGKNDRGIYDDAIFVSSPLAHLACIANTDPSVSRKGIAVLKPGLWHYKLGIHGLSKPKAKQYQALVQFGKVTVTRDDQGEDTGFFGINIHRGSYSSTSSEGCQTIHPDQWDYFISLVALLMENYKQVSLPYLLIERN